jgi:hypothetical protein
MSYITLEDLKSYLEVNSTGDDDNLENAIVAAQQEIENYCKREFEESTGTRYYRSQDLISLPDLGPGSQEVLWLGKDILSITTLTNGDETAISSTSYWLEPRNDAPYQYIRLRTDESWVFNTDGEVSVDGTWGYSTGPDATIKQLTKETAAYLFKSRDNPIADVTAIPELGQMIIPKGMPIHVKVALDRKYVRHIRIV